MSRPNPIPGVTQPRIMKEGEPTLRIHNWLYESDVRWIDAHFSESLKRSKFIRLALRRVVNAMRAKAEQAANPVHTTDLSDSAQ